MKRPDAVPFEPELAAASRAIQTLAGAPGSLPRPLVIAVGPRAARSGWAASSAIAFAEAFSARGERVILADLSLDGPALHERVGVENEEGLSDVFLFGVSLQHITRTIPGKTFRLIPASPFTPDAREVLLHERWPQLYAEMAMTQTRLLLYLPMDLDGALEFANGDADLIVCAEDTEVAAISLNDSARVRAVFVPPRADVEPQIETHRRSDAEFEKIRIPKDGARDALIADLRSRQRAALMAPTPGITPLPDAEAGVRMMNRPGERREGTPGPIFRLPATHPKKAPASDWLSRWLLLGVLLGAAGFAGWYWYDAWRDGRVVPPAPVAAAPVPRGPVSAPVVQETVGDPLPFSVAVASYQVLNLAESRVDQLREDEPDLSFFVGPIAAQGSLFYRVMAGPVGDSVSATALVDSLVKKRIKTITSGWDVLTTPYAFLLGEYASLEDARAQQRTAALKNIPSYIVQVAGPDGSPHHKVYAGAYAGHGDAEFMRPILKAAGLPDNLVERTGSIST